MANGMSKITVGVGLTNGSDVLDAQQRLNKVQQVVKTLSDEGLGVFLSEVRRTTDKLVQDVYVTNNQLANAKRALESLNSRLTTDNMGGKFRDDPIEYSAHQGVPFKTIERKVDAPRAKIAEMKSFIARHGGSMSPSEREGFYTMSMPEIPYTTGTGRTIPISSYITKNITRLNSQSRLSRQAEEAAAEEKSLESFNKRRAVTDEKKLHQLNQEKYNNLFGSKDVDKKEESGASKTLSTAKMLGAIYLVGRGIHTLIDVAQKIYNSLSAFASRAMASSLNGMSVGMSGARMYAFENAEAAKGMAPGTYSGALSGIVSKFGNITKLDQESLKSLALVMGSEVSDLIQSGMGGDRPEALLDQIIASFMDQTLQGKNSIGQNVGVEAAMREMTEYLKKIDPNMAAIFQRQMYDVMNDQNGYKRGVARGSTSSWMLENSAVNNAGSISRGDINYGGELKSGFDEFLVIFRGLVDGLMTKLGPAMEGLLFWVRGQGRAAMSEEAKEADILRARQMNTAKLTDVDNAIFAIRNQRIAGARAIMGSSTHKYNSEAEVMADAARIAGGVIPRHLAGPGFTAEERAKYIALNSSSLSMTELEAFKKKLSDQIANPDTQYVENTAANILQSQWRNADAKVDSSTSRDLASLAGIASLRTPGMPSSMSAGMLDEYGTSAETLERIRSSGATTATTGRMAEIAAKNAADAALSDMLMRQALNAFQSSNPDAARRAEEVRISASDMNVTVKIVDSMGNVLNSITQASSFNDQNNANAARKVTEIAVDASKAGTVNLERARMFGGGAFPGTR